MLAIDTDGDFTYFITKSENGYNLWFKLIYIRSDKNYKKLRVRFKHEGSNVSSSYGLVVVEE